MNFRKFGRPPRQPIPPNLQIDRREEGRDRVFPFIHSPRIFTGGFPPARDHVKERGGDPRPARGKKHSSGTPGLPKFTLPPGLSGEAFRRLPEGAGGSSLLFATYQEYR